MSAEAVRRDAGSSFDFLRTLCRMDTCPRPLSPDLYGSAKHCDKRVGINKKRAALERWVWRPTSAQALAQRCRIVLACAKGLTNQQVAAAGRVDQVTVGK